MILRVDQLVLLGVFSASIHWIIARSTIGKPLWSRARGKLDELLRCPACSGFWISAGLTTAGVQAVDGLPWLVTPAAGGLLGVALTPVFEAVILWGLERAAIEREEDPPA